jgi:hypothetical protein
LSCIYYSVFFVSVMIPMALVLGSGLPRPAMRRAMIALGVGGLLAALLILPYLAPYRAVRTSLGDRSEGEATLYSAGPVHYLSSTPDNLIYGRFADRTGRPEKRLFPGAVALLLTAVALWPPLDRRRIAYAIALLLAVDLSFGPSGLTFGWLREHVLPFRGLRAPARAGGVALLMFAALAGVGWARLEGSRRLRASAHVRALSIVVLCVMAVEYAERPMRFIRAPTQPSAVYQWLAAHAGGVVAEFPMPEEHALPLHDAEFAYASTFHWHPLVNGYSGNVPASYVELLRAVHPFPSDRALERLRGAGVRYITVHEQLFGAEAYASATAVLDQHADLRRHGPFGEAGDRSTIYEFSAVTHD